MANILAVGIATLDIINTVESYPREDSEQRALCQYKSRGGNATNTLVVLNQLGHNSAWAGVLIDEADSQTILADLQHHTIDLTHCRHLQQGKMPTSYITLNQHNGSRTIVHYRDCPEYSFDDFKTIDLSVFDWIHFEGRAIDDTKMMLQYLKQHFPNLPCSLEVEKARPDIESLFELPNLLMFSKHYAVEKAFESANDLLASLPDTLTATCTWGELGAWVKTNHALPLHVPTPAQTHIIDTLGAGDTFNAGLIHRLVNGDDLVTAVGYANQLASHKCGQLGFNTLLTHFSFHE